MAVISVPHLGPRYQDGCDPNAQRHGGNVMDALTRNDIAKIAKRCERCFALGAVDAMANPLNRLPLSGCGPRGSPSIDQDTYRASKPMATPGRSCVLG